ncbi:uncharacterized protein [Spinacia oleracea]|uniref:Integrase zinc-binding domain-containing protein n=1 Tax=Spinacia oleracea TaxID=3562 RepID=A0ABM3QY49_SPIOL|nr:uncharacterized protein LOC130463231 [Spinacia oleracea]
MKEEDHIKDLAETFANLRKYKMKLNPKKCVFGVRAGKFLEFMVSERGIDVNPDKVQAALDLPEPKTKRDVQRLTDAETRYPLIEKVAYAVVVAARKLRPYFDSHQVVVLTDQPLEKVLDKIERSGRLAAWAFELSAFGIKYQPRTAIKAQALANFLAECSYQEMLDDTKRTWEVYTDGSSTVNGLGAGVVLIPPVGKNIEYVLKFAIAYKEKGELPEDKLQARKLKRFNQRFIIDANGELMRRSFSAPLLKCVGPTNADYILREIHLGICGNHIGGRALAHKALRAGFWWPTMVSEAKALTRKCEKCQKFAPAIHQPAQALQSTLYPLPFSQWGLDIIGPFPSAVNQK